MNVKENEIIKRQKTKLQKQCFDLKDTLYLGSVGFGGRRFDRPGAAEQTLHLEPGVHFRNLRYEYIINVSFVIWVT